MSRTLAKHGIEITSSVDTPLVKQLVAVIERQQRMINDLTAEVNRLKGLPELPVRPIRPSGLHDSTNPPSRQGHEPSETGVGKSGKKPRKKKRKGRKNHKSSKLSKLKFDHTQNIELDQIPEGARRKGFRCFVVQDLELNKVTTKYRLAKYEFPDGSIVTAERPKNLVKQFGTGLRAFVIYQYYGNHVTGQLIRRQLLDLGISISSGQVSRILTEGHEQFHQEKDSLLEAAREVSKYFHTDDTTARHQGRNGHTLHIGNEFFASFSTTESKSRINFLEALRVPHSEYVLGADALFYLEYHQFPQVHLDRLTAKVGSDGQIWTSRETLLADLKRWGFTDQNHVQRITEAALWGCVMYHDLYLHQPLISDDAAQFKLLWIEHGLCWLHAERHVARLVPLTGSQRRAYDRTRDAIWRYYQRLKGYCAAPTPRKRQRLERDFDKLFQQHTGWSKVNEALRKIHSKRDGLLLVLEHPEAALNNNPSENDIRQFAKFRKISGSTRSDNGRRCRDTFLSLKTTCRKLCVSFLHYLQDRINGTKQIVSLADLIRQAAGAKA
jgi:hypothetical protein